MLSTPAPEKTFIWALASYRGRMTDCRMLTARPETSDRAPRVECLVGAEIPGCRWPCVTHGICKTPHVHCSFFRRQPDIIPSLSFSSQICQWVWGGETGETGLAARRTQKQFGENIQSASEDRSTRRRKPRRGWRQAAGFLGPVEGRVPEETSGKGCVLLLPQPRASPWDFVVQPGSALWMSQQVKRQGI